MTDKETEEQFKIISDALKKIKPKGAAVIFRDEKGVIHLYGVYKNNGTDTIIR